MRVATAQLPGPDESADHVFVTDDAVILLDGASAFEPVDLDPSIYAQCLGGLIAERLTDTPGEDLQIVVANAIHGVATRFDLGLGPSPSSTVSILRAHNELVDLYVLGDSPIHYGLNNSERVLTDDRLSRLTLPSRNAYRQRLGLGRGYGDEHNRLVRSSQVEQRRYRNVPAGYWIAEALPRAASHAKILTVPQDYLTWAVMASDGVADLLPHLGPQSWIDLATHSADQLLEVLLKLWRWEEEEDPAAQKLPRSKRHDDKAIAAILLY